MLTNLFEVLFVLDYFYKYIFSIFSFQQYKWDLWLMLLLIIREINIIHAIFHLKSSIQIFSLPCNRFFQVHWAVHSWIKFFSKLTEKILHGNIQLQCSLLLSWFPTLPVYLLSEHLRIFIVSIIIIENLQYRFII